MKYSHNQKVTCTINGDVITDARISIDKDGDPYVCQNLHNGHDAEDKLGYMYSLLLNKGFTCYSVKNLKAVEKTWDTLEYGDIILNRGGEKRIILAAFPHSVYAVNMGKSIYTAEGLEKCGCTIVQPEPEVEAPTEVTMAEVCEKFGKNVVIKKE